VSDSGPKLLMGLDLGSSAIKGVVIDTSGATLATASEPSPLSYPREEWVEYDAEDHFRAVCRVTRKLQDAVTEPVAAIAMCAASGNTLLTDGSGTPLTPVISWMDGRVRQYLTYPLESLDPEEVRQTTGWPFFGIFPLTHLAWFRESNHELYAGADRCCMNTDWLLFRLTGNWVMDHSTATTFYLQDQVARRYHAPYLDLLDLPENKLSRLVPSGSVAGALTGTAALDTGLRPGTAVCAGSFDHPSAARAVGVTQPGELMLSCGTSWVGFLPLAERQSAIEARLLCDPFLSGRGGPWAGMTSVPMIGPAIDWYITNVIAPGSDDPFTVFNESAAAAEPGSGGIKIDLCDPPGPVAGDRNNISRAVMEGAAILLDEQLAGLAEQGINFSRAVMVGGPARSAVWPHIVSEITDIPVRAGSSHSGARGAAILAGIGTGIYRDEADAFASTGGNT